MRSPVCRCLAFAALWASSGCAHHHHAAQAAPNVNACAVQSPILTGEQEPLVVRDFQDDAHALLGQPPSQRRESEVEALHSLAEAVGRLREAPRWSADNIAIIADQIEASSSRSPMRLVLIKRALREGELALEAVQRRHHNIPCLDQRVAAVRQAIAWIDDSKSFPSQRAQLDNAFLILADAFPVAVGRVPVAGRESAYIGEKDVRINRYAWGLAGGRRPDIGQLCGGPAMQIEPHATAGDITTWIFTLGIYAPSHVRVTCPARVSSR